MFDREAIFACGLRREMERGRFAVLRGKQISDKENT